MQYIIVLQADPMIHNENVYWFFQDHLLLQTFLLDLLLLVLMEIHLL